jgi:DNA repair protein RecN (Recombination protein N)
LHTTMLKNLYIHNYAIIDEITIDFSSHMNVITGETGAGKSILMGALSLILGERADTSVLLNREKKCTVEGTFVADTHQKIKIILEENDLAGDDGSNEIIIRREISANGKSRAFVNDIPVNLDLLRQVTSMLVDLHRQFDTLSLADSGFQLDVLDALAGNNSLLKSYREIYTDWKKSAEELSLLKDQKSAFNKEYDYNKFLFDELEEASFTDNELENAEAELKLLNNSEAIKNSLTQVSEMLSGGEQPLVHQFKTMQHHLDPYVRYHAALEDILKRLQSAHIELMDIADEVERLNDEVIYDSARIDELNDRISAGYKLMKKHGVQTTAQLLHIRNALNKKLQDVLNIDERIAEQEKSVAKKRQKVIEAASKLSEKRNVQTKPFEKNVNTLLVQVGMPNARIKVNIETKEPNENGSDNVEFVFDANKSNRFEPIRKVASGGELSRLMLSIKSLVAQSMDLPTLIFDEIDTGISGEAAKQVGKIMSDLAAKRQLITITHQPQIAGKANAHLFVYKEIKNDVIRTGIRLLTGEERITAIARMLSGEKPTAAALENAREMVMN